MKSSMGRFQYQCYRPSKPSDLSRHYPRTSQEHAAVTLMHRRKKGLRKQQKEGQRPVCTVTWGHDNAENIESMIISALLSAYGG